MTPTARYDPYATWYAEWVTGAAERWGGDVAGLLGPGAGRCLDLCCGTGEYAAVLRGTGRTVVGLDLSAGQLGFARQAGEVPVLGAAERLPFADASFEAVAGIWMTTDVEDLDAVLREVARILRPGGVLALLGCHPCFNAACVENLGDGGKLVHPGYHATGWQEPAPWWEPVGVRVRVGTRAVTLAALLNAVAGAGFRLDRVVEPDDEPVPTVLALRAARA